MMKSEFAVLAAAAVFVVLSVARCGGSPVTSADETNNGLQQQQQQQQQQYMVIREDELVQKLNVKCSAKDVSSCVMLKLVTYMNKLMKKNSVEIGETLEIAKKDGGGGDDEEVTAEVVRVVEHSARGTAAGYSDETAFGEVMADKLWRYVQSRALKIKVLPDADFVVSASPERDGSLDFGVSFRSGKDSESGRGKNKNMGPMMAAMMMKMAMIKVLAFKALALLVGKALFVSKLAFLLATIIGLKKLFSQQKHVTYEVVAHPHHESHGGDSYGSGGWGRSSSEIAHNMAYSGHTQQHSS